MTVLPQDLFWLSVGGVVGAMVGLVAARRVEGAWHRPLAIALASAHIGAVLGVTLLPLGGGVVFEDVSNIALQPFNTIRQLFAGTQSVRQLGGNLLLLAPAGVLVPIAWRAVRSFGRTMLVGLGLSVTIELLQLGLNTLGLSYRVIDVDDVILNVLGVALGRTVFAMGWPLWRAVARHNRARHG